MYAVLCTLWCFSSSYIKCSTRKTIILHNDENKACSTVSDLTGSESFHFCICCPFMVVSHSLHKLIENVLSTTNQTLDESFCGDVWL